MQMDTCLSNVHESSAPDKAFQVSSCRLSNSLQMEDSVCVLPEGHSGRPLLHHCFSASLETFLLLFLYHLTSQAVRQMAAMAAQTATVHLYSWRELLLIVVDCVSVFICLISVDNWPYQDEMTPLTTMGFFIA